MPKTNKTKDGSLCIHIYNQEIAGAFRYYAKLNNKAPQKLATEIIEEYLKKNLIVKKESEEK